MKQNKIKINSSQIIISAKKAPVFVRIILLLFLTVLILIPVAVMFFVLNYGDGFHIGIALSFILSWGVGFYIFRAILWNSAGREILTLNREKILYIADYRLFKDRRQEITTENLETEIIYENELNKSFSRLRLKNKSTNIETVIPTKITELEEIRNEIKIRYNCAAARD